MSSFALVTGTSRGIGAALARALLERGWTVQGVARGASPFDAREPRYRHARVDLSDPAAARAWIEGPFAESFRPQEHGRIGLVNNAGALAPLGPLHELDPVEIARSLALGAAVPLWLAGWFAGRVDGRPLRIVDLSSGAATSPYPGWAAYCAGKAALAIGGQVLALELDELPALGGRDVRVVSYAPHVVATRMQEEVRASPQERFPRRARFVELFERGELVDPAGPAREIAELLERDDLPRHSELRFRP